MAITKIIHGPFNLNLFSLEHNMIFQSSQSSFYQWQTEVQAQWKIFLLWYLEHIRKSKSLLNGIDHPFIVDISGFKWLHFRIMKPGRSFLSKPNCLVVAINLLCHSTILVIKWKKTFSVFVDFKMSLQCLIGLRIWHREITHLVHSVKIKTCFEMTFEVIHFVFSEWTVLFCHQVETNTGHPDS